jgi:NAD(P)-dependent dehydrogenase (short-subunit alcohol dehydrogenase family)
MSNGRKRWLITGISGGFGRLLAQAALDRGDSVVGTVRHAEQAAAFEALMPGRAHAVLLDVTDRQRIPAAVGEAIGTLGGLDILVNNAGYGLAGVLEELEDDEIDHVIETNLNGPLYVTRAALSALRESKGHIVNMSSMAGLVGLPGMAPYCAAKHAIEGLSESLSLELQPFGIKVSLVEPGAFRTNFFKGSERIARNQLSLYHGTSGGMTRSGLRSMSGQEPGDPAKAIVAILQVIDAKVPPLRLILGAAALGMVKTKLVQMYENIAAWEQASLSTEFEKD